MIKLGDYFAPLNPKTLLIFVGLFFFFDILGTFVKRRIIEGEDSTRVINWLIGLGIFVFVWFITSLFIAYTRTPLLISILTLSLIALPEYLKNKEYQTFFRALWSLKIPILIVLPFLPAIFVKASLPPYYADEMAYHFISPSTLATLQPAKYTGGLYANVPKLINTFYEISFSLTRTYSIARLFNFTILVTSMLFAYKILKRNFGFLPGFLFVFIFFSLPQDIVLTSTLGYVDVQAYSFLLIAIINAVEFLLTKSSASLILASTFWAMNLGTKYTGISSFISFLSILLLILFLKRKEYFKFFSKSLFIKIALTLIFFGGYWYIKNLIVYGNPIYPFIFPCFEQFAKDCQLGSGLFGDWTTKISLDNAYNILKSLFPKNSFLHVMIILAPIFAFLGSNKRIKILTILLFTAIFIELLILKPISGFYIRYHQHMQLLLLTALVIQLANIYTLRTKRIVNLLFVGLAFTSLASYLYTIRFTNSLKFLNWFEINYSIGEVNIYDWIEWRFPRMAETIFWCENPPQGERVTLARFDPDLIWYEYDGYKRVFLTNCYYENPPLEGIPVEEVLYKAKSDEMYFWIASPNTCVPDDKVITRWESEDENLFYLRRLNNLIICNSEELRQNLYYFDYSKLENKI